MYSDKENVNILTSLLLAHDVQHAVVCPGSRNAPICHNLNECPSITCYPVTDERSAGFFALGVSQVHDDAVAVCVTSGSALLNLAPAVAEAMYQHRKLIIISADRPAAYINQLQGQTIHQPDALGHLVRKAVNLPEPHDDTERWHCNRLVNEALMEMGHGEEGPVHINVPISEPLFNFTTEQLPHERAVFLHQTDDVSLPLLQMAELFSKAQRPMVLIGQTKPELIADSGDDIQALGDFGVVLDEKLGNYSLSPPRHLEEMLISIEGEEEDYLPDFIVYLGNTFVSKRLKAFLRKTAGVPTYVINNDGKLCDVSTHVTDVVQTNITDALATLALVIEDQPPTAFHDLWDAVYQQVDRKWSNHTISYSQLYAVDGLCRATLDIDCEFHYANSMPVRLGNLVSMNYMFVNRGVNGIEGSLSTAVGYASVSDAMIFCVIGDLSFFYDQNALWNNNLTSNLRILLLNNGCGGIFRTLPGLKNSPACGNIIAAEHHTTAEGICMQNNVAYIAVHNEEQMARALIELTNPDSPTPVLAEVFTDPEEDKRVLDDYYYGDSKYMN